MRFSIAIILILVVISCREKKQQSSLSFQDTSAQSRKEESKTENEKTYVTPAKFEPHISFSDFPADEIDTVRAKLAFASNKGAYRFGTIIRRAYKADKANFAGHYTFVSWGCGSPCEDGVILDRRTGKIYDAPSASLGYAFRSNSRMLVANPPDSAGFYDDNGVFGKPTIYVLDEYTKEFVETHRK